MTQKVRWYCYSIGVLVLGAILLILMGGKWVNGVGTVREGTQETQGIDDIDFSQVSSYQYNPDTLVRISENRYLLKANNNTNDGLFMVIFDAIDGELYIGCEMEGCLHIDEDCVARTHMGAFEVYKGTLVYSDGIKSREIRVVCNGEIQCLYRLEEEEMDRVWFYEENMYYLARGVLYRLRLDTRQEATAIYEGGVHNLFFYGDKIYFEDDAFGVFSMNTDGSDLRLLTEKRGTHIKVWEDRVYFRCVDYDEERYTQMEDTLYSMNLDGSDMVAVKGAVGNYLIYDDVIYYTSIETEESNTLHACNMTGGETRVVAEDVSAINGICEGTDWLLFTRVSKEGTEAFLEQNPGTTGISILELCCIRTDGTGEKALTRPKTVIVE